jgi:hypothetical protein
MKPKKVSKLGLGEIPSFKLPEKQNFIRTTFRFSKKGHEAFKNLSKQQGKKNADIFDTLIEIFDVLKKEKIEFPLPTKEKFETIRKTYIINKNTLLKINNISKKLGMKKDLFIDTMAEILMLISEKRTIKKHQNYQSVLNNIISPFRGNAEEIEKKLKEKLGEDDPIVSQFGIIIVNIMNLYMEIDSYLQEGTPISTF